MQEMQGLALLQDSKDRGGRIKATMAGISKVIKGCKERLETAYWNNTKGYTPKCSHRLQMRLRALAAEQKSIKQRGGVTRACLMQSQCACLQRQMPDFQQLLQPDTRAPAD